MRFQVLDIAFNPPHPVTGETVAPADRLNRIVDTAVLAEELGFDAFAVGERHAGPVLSSAPTVLLGAIAARTSRILLSTGVTVLSLHDPIRLAEDLATVDQLSRGRLEIVIGKGNEDLQYPLLGLDITKQYEYLRENYELLKLLLSAEDAVERGPALVGSPERVAEKILDYHSSFGHVLQSVSVNHLLAPAQQEDVLRRFAAEVIPQVRAEVRTDLWGPLDERRAAGFTAVDPPARVEEVPA